MSSSLTPAQRTLRARIGAYALHAARDPRETTQAARAAFLQRFEREVDPGGVLPPEERERRALVARRDYFAGLARRRAPTRKTTQEEAARRADLTRAQLAASYAHVGTARVQAADVEGGSA